MSDFGEQVDDNPFATRGFIVSAVLMGVIALLAILVVGNIFLGDTSGQDDVEAAVTPDPSASPSAPDVPADDSSVCGLTEVEMTGVLDDPPEDAQWELVGRMATPSVEGHGPGQVDDDGFRSCFARTPLGAVLAASNWAAMGSHPELSEQLTDRVVAEGPGREAALSNEENGDEAAISAEDEASIQIAGFRLVSYDGDEANVQLAFTSSYGLNMVFSTDMRWEDGDWKHVLANDGELVTPPYPVEAITGFVRWYGA